MGDIQILLAHASSETTKIYTHPNFELASEYINKIPTFNGFCRENGIQESSGDRIRRFNSLFDTLASRVEL